ncbi:MAG: hypothetical protein ACI4MA_03150 [Treponema sp.]
MKDSGWTVVPRDDFTPDAVNAQAVEENLMKGNLEAGYILYLDGKAIAVLEAKRKENGIEHLVMTGATNNRSEIVKKFKTDNRYKVFLMTLKRRAAGNRQDAQNWADKKKCFLLQDDCKKYTVL